MRYVTLSYSVIVVRYITLRRSVDMQDSNKYEITLPPWPNFWCKTITDTEKVFVLIVL